MDLRGFMAFVVLLAGCTGCTRLTAIFLDSSGGLDTLSGNSVAHTLNWSLDSPLGTSEVGEDSVLFPDDRSIEAYATVLRISYPDGAEWNWPSHE